MAAEEERINNKQGPPAVMAIEVLAEERVHVLVRQLAETESALADLAGGIDGILDPETSTPVLLRQAQADLADSEERYNRLVSRTSGVVFEMTPEGRVIFVNEAVTEVLGYTPPELIGQAWWEMLLPCELSSQLLDLNGRLQHGDVTGYELTVLAKDGARTVLALNSANRYGLDGSLLRVVGIATDITARKQAEAQRELAHRALSDNREQLQALSRRLVQALEDERRAIAQELHDESGQALTALSLALGALARDSDCPPTFRPVLQSSLDTVAQVQEDLHRLVARLRPASLDKLGLVPALRQCAADYERQTGIKVAVAAVGTEDRRLPSEVETVLYRVVQEALTNVARHAKASSVGVVVQRHDHAGVAIIEDDGIGFDVEAAMRRGRLGLVGMRERAEMLGGTLVIESTPGQGTTVFVEVPCYA